MAPQHCLYDQRTGKLGLGYEGRFEAILEQTKVPFIVTKMRVRACLQPTLVSRAQSSDLSLPPRADVMKTPDISCESQIYWLVSSHKKSFRLCIEAVQ
jgi:hypothetical protein